jgi:predicted NBD/HSP70 family sugar kinase
VVSNSAEPPVARQLSVNAVIQTIRARGPISRAELAKVTGFSKQTISEVVHELAEEGWLRPCGRTSGHLGRSAVTYEINGRAALAAGIDLGGSKISAGICDLTGEILAESLTATDPRGGTHLVDQVAGILDGLADEAAASTGELRLLVLGTPGVMQSETGRIRIAPNVPGLDTIDLRGLLAERLGVSVLVENDVNLAARGEQWRGRGAGLKNFAFVALGTGIGMGIVADGHLLRGAHGAAGEISYLPLGGDPYDPSGFTMGTLERAVGSAAITRRFAGFGGREGATVREVFEALGAGDEAAIATIEETARLIAPAIAAIGAMLDPEIVVLGGSVGIRDELIEAILRFLPRCTPDPPRVEASVLGSRAALIGALGAAVSRMYHDLFGVDLPATDFSPPHWPETRRDGSPAYPALS